MTILEPGTVVEYHGSITHEHGVYVVQAIPGVFVAGYTICDREYPFCVLSQVRRQSLTPTGEHSPLCENCSHPRSYRFPGQSDYCAVSGCGCARHDREEKLLADPHHS